MVLHLLLVQAYLLTLLRLKLHPGCETAVSTGTITVEESATINVIDDPTGTSYCDGEDFNGANALIFEFSNAFAGLQINGATPLPGGLSFGLQGGFFNRYAITGTLNSPTL